nr:unnamed protein product [Callosobruchus analis]
MCLTDGSASALKDVAVTIPLAVRVMDTITLQCRFDLEGEPLYTLKWYKGGKEFYREEDVPHHTFPLPSERNIHAVIRGVPATLKEADIKEELQQRGYAPLHIIRLKRNAFGGGDPAQTREIKGIRSKSNPYEVVLRNVQPEATGKYKCEVSSDAPNFYTVMESAYLFVVSKYYTIIIDC